MFLKFLKKINSKALVSFSFFTILSFFGAALIFNIPPPAVYGAGTANAWNLERVGTDLNVYFSTGGANALILKSNGEMQARKIYDIDNTSQYFVDPSLTSSLNTLGIGITAPFYKLQTSSGFAKTDTGNRVISMFGSNEGTNSWGLKMAMTGAATTAASSLVLQTGDNATNNGNLGLQSYGGNVGIGTTAPGFKLNLQGGHGDTQALLHSTGGATPTTESDLFMWASEPGCSWDGAGIGNNFKNGGTPCFGRINTARGGSYMRLLNNAIELATVDPAGTVTQSLYTTGGSVGIGTTVLSDKLTVNGSAVFGSTTQGGIRMLSGGASQGIIRPTIQNGVITITDDSQQTARGTTFSNGGYVGIRTAPSYPLHVPWISGDGAGYTSYFGSNSASNNQTPIIAETNSGHAVRAATTSGYGVYASSVSSLGVYGESTNNIAVYGRSLGGSWAGHFYASGPSALYARADGNAAAWTTQIDRVSDAALNGGGTLLIQNYGVKDDASGYILYATSDSNGNQGGADAEFRILDNGTYYADGPFGGAADYAEYFETNDTSIDKTEVVCADPQGHSKINHCSSPNADNVLGVISTKPGVIGAVGDDTTIAHDEKEKNPHWKIVGLLGQIPTKVSTENGAINAGDFLASSSIPGVAMKSTKPGMTIGKALENYSGKEVGKINVLVQPTWHGNPSSGDSQQQQLDILKKEIELLKSKK